MLFRSLDDQSEQETSTRVIRGLVTGLICGVVARGLGLLTMVWAFDSWTSSTSSSYSVISDYLRVMLNGNFWLSLAGIALAALAGAFIAYALPYFVTEKETE